MSTEETRKPKGEHPFRTAKRMAFYTRKVSGEAVSADRRDHEGKKILPVGRRGQVLVLAIALFLDTTGTTSLGGDRGGPSQRLLGSVVGYSERATRMALRELDRAGIIEREVPTPAERREGRRTRYTVPLWTWRDAKTGDASDAPDAARGAPTVGRAAMASLAARTVLDDPKGPAATRGRQNAGQGPLRPLFDRAAAAVAALAAKGAAPPLRGASPQDRQGLPLPSVIPTGYPPAPRGGDGTATAAPSEPFPQASETLAQLRAAVAARGR